MLNNKEIMELLAGKIDDAEEFIFCGSNYVNPLTFLGASYVALFVKKDASEEVRMFLDDADEIKRIEREEVNKEERQRARDRVDARRAKDVEYKYHLPLKVIYRIGATDLEDMARKGFGNLTVLEVWLDDLRQREDNQKRKEALVNILLMSGYGNAAENVAKQTSWKKVRETVNFFERQLC